MNIKIMLSRLELLKIDLMANGMRVTKRARQALTQGGKVPLSLFEYATTTGIPLKFKGSDIYVNSPFGEDFCRNANWKLHSNDGTFFLLSEKGEQQEVEPIPLPSYFNKRNPKGEKWSWFAMTHTDRVRISPIAGCFFSCQFCDLSRTYRYQKKSIDDLIDSIRVALSDPILPAKHILISGGTPKPSDENYMDSVYERVTQEFNVPVDVMMIPRRDPSYIDWLYSIGVNELSINLELFNQDFANRIMREKSQIGIAKYLQFLERAVKIYGKNNVRSILIVGLEPIEDTLKGIEALAERGVSPVLSPFRPSPKTPLAHLLPPTKEQMIEVYERGAEIVDKYGIKFGPRCIPCHHNTLTFPDGSSFYKYS